MERIPGEGQNPIRCKWRAVCARGQKKNIYVHIWGVYNLGPMGDCLSLFNGDFADWPTNVVVVSRD